MKSNFIKYLSIVFILLFIVTITIAQRQKVLFDCDLGDDIDDAFALGMLLANQDKFEIIGITTAYGRTNDRASLALKFLYECGQEHIPVFSGRNTAQTNERANWYADQFYFSKGFAKIKPQSRSAADFIVESINKYQSDLIIISVGPVTNLADVIDRDAKVLQKVKAIYSMFGSFYVSYNSGPTPEPEWNVKCDIVSAKKLVRSGANIIYAGLDITAMIKLDKVSRDKLFARHSPMTDMLEGLYTLWGHETPTLFDPIAIGMIIYPELFKTKALHISVDDIGNTVIENDKSPNAQVGVYVNGKEFLHRFTKSLLTQNLER